MDNKTVMLTIPLSLKADPFNTSALSEKLMLEEKQRLCRECLRKDPPVETVLSLGQNILESRYNRKDWICDDCLREKNRQYRTGEKIQYAEYLAQLHEETIEELEKQWNDPAYKRLKIHDRVYKIWDKYNRRTPSKGIRKTWILEVIMADQWFIDAHGIVQDWFDRNGFSKTKQMIAKPYLMDFIQNNLTLLQIPYRHLCENRWDSIVMAIAYTHAGRDKLVAKPAHEDPVTKERIDNWFLLTEQKDLEYRINDRKNRQERLEEINNEETGIVDALAVETVERIDKSVQEDSEHK